MSAEKFGAPYKKGDFIGKKYEVYDILGMGGFGIVYLVYHHETESVYALKTFRDEYLESKEMQERFKKEANIWIDLERHPYLIRAKFVDEISGRLFIGIEYIAPDEDGLNSLDGYLKRKPPDLAQSLRWGIQFCHGMEYAYSKGIRAHRDIKPANILIGVDKAVKITDFGIAGVIGQARISGIRMDIRNSTVGFSCQTVEGSGFGTPTHMPPEQFTNAASCDERSDIYSFGIVLYQMAAGGNLPFLPNLPRDNSDDEHIRFWHEIHRLHSLSPVPKLNSPLFPIIQRCLEKEPKKRFQSFAEIRSELEPLLKKLTGEVIKAPKQKELEAWEWVNKGFSFNSLGKYQEAIACYDRAIEIDPRLVGAWNGKGVAFAKLGRYQEEIACYDKAIGIDPREAGAWNNKGVALENLGKYQEAIVCYDRAIEIDPRLVEAWNGKGGALSKLGRHQEAIVCYDKAIGIDPRDAGAWYSKGVALSELGRYQEAIACYDRALEIDAGYAEAWHNKGSALGNLGKYHEAIACCDKALEINPIFMQAWSNKGNALSRLGRHQEAIGCYDRAIEIDPRNAEAWYSKGLALAKLGRYQEAIACCDKALEIDPRHANAWHNKGFALGTLGKYHEAIACYDKAIEIDPRDAKAWYYKGVILSELGKYQEAIACCDKAIEIDPRLVEAWGNKGVALYDLGRHQEAIEAYENFVRFAPSDDADKVAQVKAFIQELKAKTGKKGL